MGNQSNDRPVKKPILKYVHEEYGHRKAEDIHEQITPFAETDAGKRPDMPFCNGYMPVEKTFEEYSEELKLFFDMKLTGGILEVRAHTPGYDGFVWSLPSHAAVHKLFDYVNADRDIEVMIFGGSGENFFHTIGNPDCYRDASQPMIHLPEGGDPDYTWTSYERQYFDGTADIESQVNLSIPLITVWNGGAFHSDLFLFSDITIATKDAWTTEQHFRVNMVPGDGVQIVWRELMGRKRFSYAELTGQIITAKMALDWGMVNEVETDVESAYKRAQELADLIMHTGTRQTRRLTTQVLRRPWKKDVADELRDSFSIEMWNTQTEQSPHSPVYWECAKAQAKACMEAEEKGKVVRPRMGPFIEEDPVV